MTGNDISDNGGPQTECFVCGKPIDVQEDEWWQHSWQENPAGETVEKAMEESEFRDWFQENKVLCSDCHKQWIRYIQDMQEAKA